MPATEVRARLVRERTAMQRRTFIRLGSSLPLAAAIPAFDSPLVAAVLDWANDLVRDLTPDRNAYGSHPTFVIWSDPAAGALARNRSVCSSFVSRLFERTYGYDADDRAAWFGKPNPQAVDYYDTIVSRNGFTRIETIAAIEPGDLLAIAYPPGSHPTGHVMLVAARAVARDASPPLVAATTQYELEVIDSAASGHGPSDSRNAAGAAMTGAGRGTLRLYADAAGAIAGHAWSTSAGSVYRPADVRRPVVGRYDPESAPRPSGSDGDASLHDDAIDRDDATFDEK